MGVTRGSAPYKPSCATLPPSPGSFNFPKLSTHFRGPSARRESFSILGQDRMVSRGPGTARQRSDTRKELSLCHSSSSQALTQHVDVQILVHRQLDNDQPPKLAGSAEQMGAWDLSAAPEMRWTAGNVWALKLQLLPARYEFKFVTNSGSWEECENHAIQVSPEPAGISLLFQWGNNAQGAMQKVPLITQDMPAVDTIQNASKVWGNSSQRFLRQDDPQTLDEVERLVAPAMKSRAVNKSSPESAPAIYFRPEEAVEKFLQQLDIYTKTAFADQNLSRADFVSFSVQGPAGSGKTTLCENLLPAMRELVVQRTGKLAGSAAFAAESVVVCQLNFNGGHAYSDRITHHDQGLSGEEMVAERIFSRACLGVPVSVLRACLGEQQFPPAHRNLSSVGQQIRRQWDAGTLPAEVLSAPSPAQAKLLPSPKGRCCVGSLLDEAQNIIPQVMELGRSRQEAVDFAEQLHYALAHYSCGDTMADQAESARDGVFLFHLYAGTASLSWRMESGTNLPWTILQLPALTMAECGTLLRSRVLADNNWRLGEKLLETLMGADTFLSLLEWTGGQPRFVAHFLQEGILANQDLIESLCHPTEGMLPADEDRVRNALQSHVDNRIRMYTLGDIGTVGGEQGLLAISLLGILQIPCPTNLLVGNAGMELTLSEAASSGIFKMEYPTVATNTSNTSCCVRMSPGGLYAAGMSLQAQKLPKPSQVRFRWLLPACQGRLHGDVHELLVAAQLQANLFTRKHILGQDTITLRELWPGALCTDEEGFVDWEVELADVQLVRDAVPMMTANDSFLAFPERDGAVDTSVEVTDATIRPREQDDTFSTDFLATDKVVLLDTARGECAGFDIRVVFQRPKRRPIIVLIQAKRIDPGPAVPPGEKKKEYRYVKQTAFLPSVEKARNTARDAANKLDAAVVFLTLNTGDPADMASLVAQHADHGENLMFLLGDDLKAWLPLLSSRPSLVTQHSQESP